MKNAKFPDPLRAPIDWKAWEVEAANSNRSKGKRSPEICAKLSAAQRARFARQRAALAEALAAAAKIPRPPPPPDPQAGLSATDRLLGAMEPGKWYAYPDLAKASGAKYGSVKGFVSTWAHKGWLDKAPNPEWMPVKMGARQEPKWLYRVAKKIGERHRLAMALQ